MAPSFFKVFSGIQNGFFNFWVNSFTEVFFRQSNFHTFDVLTDFWSKVGNADRSRSRVFSIFAGNRIEQEGIFLTVGAKARFGLVSYRKQWDRIEKPFRRLVWDQQSVEGSRLADGSPVSEPSDKRTWPEATAAQNHWWSTRNLAVVPSIFSCTVVGSLTWSTMANSSMLVFPTTIMPLAFALATAVASKIGS